MPMLQIQELKDKNSLWASLGIKSQARVGNLFRNGLSAGVLSPQDVFSALPVKAKKDEAAAKEILDWFFDCFEQLNIRIVLDRFRNPLRGGIISTRQIEILFPETPAEKNAQKVLGSITFSLFKAMAISKKNSNRQKETELCDKIVQLNLGLARKWASEYIKNAVGSVISFDDLYQESCIALMNSVSFFNYLSGFRFSSYASTAIKWKIKRFLQNHSLTIRIPNKKWSDIAKLKQVRQKLALDSGQQPLMAELKEKLGWSLERLKGTVDAKRVKEGICSLDAPIGPNSDLTFAEVISFSKDESEMENSQFQEEFRKEVVEILRKNNLSTREIGCFKEYFFSRQTYEKIGETLGLCKERVRQLIEKSLEILRKPKISEKLANFE